jgi:hypothetical protein
MCEASHNMPHASSSPPRRPGLARRHVRRQPVIAFDQVPVVVGVVLTFPDVEGTISLVEGAPGASSVEVTIDTTTLTSDTNQLTTRAQAEFSINRFDWETDYKGAADDLIRDEVLLKFDLRAERAGGDTGAAATGV